MSFISMAHYNYARRIASHNLFLERGYDMELEQLRERIGRIKDSHLQTQLDLGIRSMEAYEKGIFNSEYITKGDGYHMITPETHPNQTIVYSKNDCVQCKNTKQLMDMQGIEYLEVNIDDENTEEYLAYIKDTLGARSMPVVYPAKHYTTEAWFGFQPQKVTALGFENE